MGTQSELAIIFLLAGLGILLVAFLIIGLIIYACQRSRRRRRVHHLENVTITNKNFDSQSKYSKTASSEYISPPTSGFTTLAHHFHHHPLGVPKKTFEAPSAPLTPPSSGSSSIDGPTATMTDVESPRVANVKGSLRSVIVVDDVEAESNARKPELETPESLTQIGQVMEKSSPIDANQDNNHEQQKRRPETAPATGTNRERNEFLIDVVELKSSSNQRPASATVNRPDQLIMPPANNSTHPRKFPKQMDEIQESENERLYAEFDRLNQLAETKSTNVAQTLANIRRNRYYDILPFDENRVQLKGRENDYINASYIHDPDTTTVKYIAAQGPIGEAETVGGRRDPTIQDFWHMIWQERIDCLVMLTNCVENRRQKCARYWPENADENVRIDDELSMNLYCYTEDEICFTREIWLEKKGEGTRKIMQWHYQEWKDTTSPTNAENLLTFIERVRKSAKRCPILVHCSAGVGRTGVYIGLDLLLDRLETERIIDVYDVVQKLRKDRANTVQNHDQYSTLYELIARAISNRLQVNGP